jgi:hypothetical protein
LPLSIRNSKCTVFHLKDEIFYDIVLNVI